MYDFHHIVDYHLCMWYNTNSQPAYQMPQLSLYSFIIYRVQTKVNDEACKFLLGFNKKL